MTLIARPSFSKGGVQMILLQGISLLLWVKPAATCYDAYGSNRWGLLSLLFAGVYARLAPAWTTGEGTIALQLPHDLPLLFEA